MIPIPPVATEAVINPDGTTQSRDHHRNRLLSQQFRSLGRRRKKKLRGVTATIEAIAIGDIKANLAKEICLNSNLSGSYLKPLWQTRQLFSDDFGSLSEIPQGFRL